MVGIAAVAAAVALQLANVSSGEVQAAWCRRGRRR
jgi:hypothetical protein